MQAEIITIGDELLIGQTIDTNSAWIGSKLAQMGIEVFQITSITDTASHITNALEEAVSRSNLIFITGGLGPTKDDITKKTLCEYFDSELKLNEEVLESIRHFFASFGKTMLPSNIDQAMLPTKAKIIRNWQGTASGMWFEKEGKVFVSMPGVPYEMKAMMEESVLPMVGHFFDITPRVHKTVMTQGIGESNLAECIEPWETQLRSEGYGLAYLPSPGLVKLRITGYGENSAEVSDRVYRKVKELQPLIEKFIFGYDGQLIEEAVGELLKKKKATVSTAESCTAGYVSSRITGVPGSSQYFMGSIVAYSYESKTSQLGVNPDDLIEYGAVSDRVVEQMAQGVRTRIGTDYSIATSGIAGPSGGTPEKPVGTVWIAVAGPNGVVSKRFQFGNDRGRNIQKTAVTALNMLRKLLIDRLDWI